jgi:hypothetical protein
MPASRLIAAALLALSAGCRAAAQQPAGVESAAAEAAPADSHERTSAAVAASSGATAPPATGGTCGGLRADSLALPVPGGTCDENACAAAGGVCTFGGFACPKVCARRTHDSGKPCQGSADCEAGCFGLGYVPAGTRAQGTCATSYVNRGCKNPVENGLARGTMCAE